MSTLTVILAPAEAERLAELAKREGAAPEEIAAAAVRARLDEDAAWRGEIAAGLQELDAGAGMTLDDFEREMDVFVAGLRAKRG